ncbi:MAG: HEAT repeat domain-containing protein [Gracilibacteraceae bacterium]|jgi:epoxyqueuosine reductase|nr:HEAT repeat domain-containing protein [Gracilibacteraceae bacterium]
MSLTADIKDFALDLGFQGVGITAAEDFSDYLALLAQRGDYDFYLADPRDPAAGSFPRQTMPGAESIIVLAWDYAQKAFPPELTALIGRIYLARCYGAPAHRLNGARNQLMRDFLEQCGCRTSLGGFLPGRWAARRAGVATGGRNNFAYVKGSGSFVVLSWFLLDKELEYDEPTMECRCPENCRACVEACPTGALSPLRLDPRRCVSFNNWWTQEGRPLASAHVPEDLRAKIGTRVHGCDLCQEACPRNQFCLRRQLPEDPFLVAAAGEFSLTKMLLGEEDFYRRWVAPLMYNYIKEKKYFQRNAAIALGNEGHPDSVPALRGALSDPEPLVREYAAWALGQIGGSAARRALEHGLAGEKTPAARREIATALEKQ